MNLIRLMSIIAVCISGHCYGQRAKPNAFNFRNESLEFLMGFNSGSQNVSLCFQTLSNDNVSNTRKPWMMQIGLGFRFTSWFGSDEYFVTVPEMIKSSQNPLAPNIPDPDPAKKDSVHVVNPQMNSLNLMFNFNFQIEQVVRIGLNGDIIGIGMGAQKQGTYINGSLVQAVSVTPEKYNCFWTGGGDHSGMLLVEFYFTVDVSKKLAIKGSFQFFDLEYRTDTQVQTYPRPNDRFRNAQTMEGIGLIYSFWSNKPER